ncbi:hypothetical protein LCI18_002268 [Fusarium solani-melongenae]|uniref:Uncharacterized protein n=1 Tax=Fusarium solani subsp. cucurbitae TaxID=2747967 RepID=A0ACD3YR48_FUSSC|nr:hypothetical protein LCI18_002268 [Fusarium solani-melongenae]
MAPQESEKPDIPVLVSACKDLFANYCTSHSAPFESRQNAKQQRDRFSLLEPDLAVFARSNEFLGYDEIRTLVTGQLSVLRTNLEFVAPRARSDNSSLPKESQGLEWVRQLEGTLSDAFDAIEAIIGRLEKLKAIIQQLSEAEDDTEKVTTRSAFMSIKRVVNSDFPDAFPHLQDHLATSILKRHSSLQRPMNQRHQPADMQQITLRGVTFTLADSSGRDLDSSDSQSNCQPSRDLCLGIPRPLSSFNSRSISSSSQSSTTATAENEHIDYPEPPKAEDGKPGPLCPYCYKVLESSDLSQPGWNDTPFQDSKLWEKHMEERHGEDWARQLLNPLNKQLATITQSNSVTSRTEPTCPLCYSWSIAKGAKRQDESWQQPFKLGELAKHIGNHMLRLALNSWNELEKNACQTSPDFSSEEIESGSGRHASNLQSDNPSNEDESTAAEGHSLEQDEPKVSEAMGLSMEHNPVAANERDGCCDMILKRSNTDNSSTPSSTTNLESCRSRQDTRAEAETVNQQVMQLRFRSSSSEHPDSLSSMVKTAKEPLEQRKYQEPEEEYCKAPELHVDVLGASYPRSISDKGSWANALVREDKLEEAKNIYEDILRLGTKAHGKEHRYTLSCQSNLASILEKKQQYVEAEKLYRYVWKTQQRMLRVDHPDTLASYNKLANALTRLRRFDDAILIYTEALEKRSKELGRDHSDTIITLGNLANALQNQGQYSEAKRRYEDAKTRRKELFEGNYPHLQWIEDRLNEASKKGE